MAQGGGTAENELATLLAHTCSLHHYSFPRLGAAVDRVRILVCLRALLIVDPRWTLLIIRGVEYHVQATGDTRRHRIETGQGCATPCVPCEVLAAKRYLTWRERQGRH